MESDIQLLELATGIKDALIGAGLCSIESILNNTASDISSKVGVDLYVAQIIFEEARRVTTEMSRASAMFDASTAEGAFTPTTLDIDIEEMNVA
jgi:dihydroxyacetone kinase DhaKLM complex PTS-EIIA-like component DhaM